MGRPYLQVSSCCFTSRSAGPFIDELCSGVDRAFAGCPLGSEFVAARCEYSACAAAVCWRQGAQVRMRMLQVKINTFPTLMMYFRGKACQLSASPFPTLLEHQADERPA